MEQYDAKQNKQRKDIDGGTCTILANALIKLDTRKIKDGRGKPFALKIYRAVCSS